MIQEKTINPKIFYNYFTELTDTHLHNTRASKAGALQVPRILTTTYGTLSIMYQSIQAWNNLLANHALPTDSSRSKFSSYLKNLHLTTYI